MIISRSRSLIGRFDFLKGGSLCKKTHPKMIGPGLDLPARANGKCFARENTMRATPWRLGLVSLAVLLIGLNARAEDAIPFPAALDAAAVTVDRLDSVLDYALLIGNGDLNALVYTDRGQLKLNLTKNDVWDARLDADRDPPLPTLELVKKWAFDRGATSAQDGSVILDEGSQWEGPDSYHARAEQFAASLAINELLLQSVADVVRVFPAWPLDKPAHFRRLRAQGGFLISAACEHGKVGPVWVESTAGGRLRLLSRWPAIEVVFHEGGTRSLTPNGEGIVELDTQSGQRCEFH